MATDTHPFAFGHYLRDRRLAQNISLEVISARTRIGMSNLLSIEREDHQQLPAVVFVVGYLKAYAQAVGADPAEAIRRYHASRRAYNETLKTDVVVRSAGIRFWFRLFGALCLLAALIGLCLFGFNRWQGASRTEKPAMSTPGPAAEDVVEDRKPEPKAASPVEALETVPAETTVQQPAAADVDAAGSPGHREPAADPKATQPLSLAVLAVEETWLKVITDNQKPVEYMLKPGQKVVLGGKNGFNLLIGNAAGVKLTFNGKPVTVPGKSGQVVTLQLP